MTALARSCLPCDVVRRYEGALPVVSGARARAWIALLVRDLFWTDGEERAEKFRIAAEMIVEPQVIDEIGREVENTSTYLRYEIEIRYEEPDLTKLYATPDGSCG